MSTLSHRSAQPAALPPPDILSLGRQLKAVEDDAAFLRLAVGLLNAAGGMLHVQREDHLHVQEELLSRQALLWSPTIGEEVLLVAQSAGETGTLQYSQLATNPAVWIISAPLIREHTTGCLSLIMVIGTTPPEPFLVICQLLAAHLWPEPQRTSETEIFSLCLEALQERTASAALIQLDEGLRHWSQASQLAIGTRNTQGRMHLSFLSHVLQFDQRTELTQAFNHALTECSLHNDLVREQDTPQTATTASPPIFRQLLALSNKKHYLGWPLTDQDGSVRHVLLFLWDQDLPACDDWTHQLQQVAALLRLTLGTILQPPSSFFRSSDRRLFTEKRPNKVALLAVIALGGLLALPFPFRIQTTCRIKPVMTHYITARFDGIFQKSLVRPGDQVAQGTLLGRLDGRELALQHTSLQAEREKSATMRNQYLATGNTAAAQISRLDEQRLAGQIELVQAQQAALDLISPAQGVVLSDDLQRNEGSPVSRGQTLFEVAPLDRMDSELAIAEESIAHVQSGMHVSIQLTAYAGDTWEGKLAHIVPKSVIQEGSNVFIGHLELDNKDQRLQPGMQGKALIDAGWKPLGWQLFRRPWYTALHLLGKFFSFPE